MIPEELWLTPSAVRILDRARRCAQDADLDTVTGQLVIACSDEESLAGALLRESGITTAEMPIELFEDAVPHPAELTAVDGVAVAKMMQTIPAELSRIVAEARRFARQGLLSEGVSSEHLLAATLQFETPVCRYLQQHGLTSESVMLAAGETIQSVDAIPVNFSLTDSSDSPVISQTTEPMPTDAAAGRVLDASLNRAREGMRVLEDYARFVLNNSTLVHRLKDLRHRLAASEQSLQHTHTAGQHDQPMTSRDIAGDVGTGITGAQEQIRRRLPDIVHANARRVQESLRSLEEFGKLVSSGFASEMKQLRYETYEVHQQMLPASETHSSDMSERRQRLLRASVCVLVTEARCRGSWKCVVESCLSAGAEMIQLREKQLDDQQLLDRATWLANACRSAGALSIINDRVDVAQLSGADGVHLGQDDCAVSDARRLLGSDSLIGLSTHSLSDIGSEAAAAADYLGVGPVFSSRTKEFNGLAGLAFVREAVAAEQPWFAIGGIDTNNVQEVVEAGARRVAVSAAVIEAEQPGQVIQQLQEQLREQQKEPDC